MKTESIVITGCGIISAAGSGTEATRQALVDGRSGLGALQRFSSPRCGHFPVGEVQGVPDVAGQSRTVLLGRIAIAEALQSSGYGSITAADAEQTALVVGTCVGGMPETEGAVADVMRGTEPEASVWRRHECGATTAALASEFGLEGASLTISNACSSGAQAIAVGAELLRSGMAHTVIAGGTDALCRLTLNGFASLLAVDPEGCRPFDRSRRGMSLGEGAAFLILETSTRAEQRGVASLATLAGWAATCDAHHATAPEPDGRGAESAMRSALQSARMTPDVIDYINAHGTGTLENDRAESRALRRVFGDTLPPTSSTKRVFGHTLASSGAIEAVVCLLAMRHGFVPGNAGFDVLDPECGIVPVRRTRPQPVAASLSNSFGFGGNNTVLVFTESSRP